MVEAHCHLNFQAFKDDYDKVIKDAEQAGVTAIINAGTSLESSLSAVELAQKYPHLYAVVAIHPHHADKVSSQWLEELEIIAKKPKVVGIGECGMDFFSYKSNAIVDPALQEEVFIRQIELANKLKLPLQIHNRQAGKEILTILNANKDLLLDPPGMLHCFAGDIDFLKSVLDMGFYIGFDGNITYPGLAPNETTDLKDLVKYTPIDRIIVESDSPYLTPVPHRGERNEPKYVIITAEFITTLKNTSLDKVIEETDKNVYTLFKIS